MGDIGDYWREHNEYQVKQEARFWSSPQGRSLRTRLAHKKQRALNRAISFAELHNLTYTRFDSSTVEHNRVKNPTTRQFVDWWDTGTLRKVDGTYGVLGDNDCNLTTELEKLIT